MTGDKQNKCLICKQPEFAHRIAFWDGVAHTIAPSVDGRMAHCSREYSDIEHLRGQIQALMTIVRSLRWRAGRMRTLGGCWEPDDLDEYSNKVMTDIERLERLIREW